MNMPASRNDSVKVLITGSEGFIGKNLRAHLAERDNVEMVCFNAGDSVSQLPDMLGGVDFVFHLAGVNRPEDPTEFETGNRGLTQALCDAVGRVVESTGKKMAVLLTSSIQAAGNSPYGQSKRAAEKIVFSAGRKHGVPVHVFRLPNVFGKWCRPNYNSAVATFCHNIARGLPIEIHDRAAPITLVYIDDVVEQFIKLMDGANPSMDAGGFATVTPQYSTTVGEIAEQLRQFKEGRHTLNSERVGTGLSRALYATYISYLPVDEFAYALPRHADTRGVFVEMLKTPDCGQFSYFTARPGVTRGGHYHHSKTEKFLVIKGQARFQFRHLQTGETYQVITNGDRTEIVETVPGWTHDVTNIGPDELIVMLWANEVFNRARPDTYARPL
jgi:UDP-2-acetamido-2,6-beta-L-arabino-hexul-4-ose reductase